MKLCLNPSCSNPRDLVNADQEICQYCGSCLLFQGRYRVSRVLGENGFGKTYQVDDLRFETKKVMKVLTIAHPKSVALFQQEAQTLMQLSHPGLPHVDNDGFFTIFFPNSQEKIYCLVMEYLSGINLDEWYQQQGRKSIDEVTVINWLKQLGEILEKVHKKLYFHRNIKPSNLILQGNGQLGLIDFGSTKEVAIALCPPPFRAIAHLAEVGTTNQGYRMLSPGYTPTEQALGKAVPQSDFFALGRTFVYLLTGKNPSDLVEDPRTGKLLWQHHTTGISQRTIDLIDYLMAPQSQDRPHNAEIILQRLRAIERSFQPLDFSDRAQFLPSEPQTQSIIPNYHQRETKTKDKKAELLERVLAIAFFLSLLIAGQRIYQETMIPLTKNKNVSTTKRISTSFLNSNDQVKSSLPSKRDRQN
ncbi:MAG: serine/threonine-protein kinase [Oscillatoria sp. PMC 1068.18]|nr:serine/threonine-protein kinase [Oscillatoria sp. PMC 1076.18]MEC4990449.1 serine/threonine-protein kinase [Oscillatoria sp. PMC 1068.18]